jgi:hypothetical protein
MKSELKETLWACFLVVLVVSILAVAFTALNGTLYPWWLSIQRRAVEQSKSFTDANNNMLESYKLEYLRLDTKIAEANGNESLTQAYEAQQKAIVEKMCKEISTMAQGTVNPNTLTWLNSNGGCR